MAQVTLRNRTLDSTQLVHLLAGYQMLPQLWREIVIDEAISSIQLSTLESAQAQKQFDTHYQLSSQRDRLLIQVNWFSAVAFLTKSDWFSTIAFLTKFDWFSASAPLTLLELNQLMKN